MAQLIKSGSVTSKKAFNNFHPYLAVPSRLIHHELYFPP